MGIARISYSSANQFEQCPARFHAERVLGIKGERTMPLLVGSFMHEATDRYIIALGQRGLAYDYEQAQKTLDECWSSSLREGIPEAYHEELSEMMQEIAKHLQKRDVTRRVASEQKIAFNQQWAVVPYDGEEAWLRMKLDLLEVDAKKATVWDLKTGHGVQAATDSMQLKVYAAGVMAALPDIEQVEVELYYPRKNIVHKHMHGEKEATEGRRWIKAIWDRIQRAQTDSAWPARPGIGCAYCPVFDGCEARKITPPKLPPTTRDEAAKLVERLLFLDLEREDVKERVRGWVDDHGAVEIGDMVAGYSVRAIYEYDLDELLPILAEHGIDPMKVMKPDTKKLERLTRRNQALEEKISAIAIDKSQTPFSIKKAGA